MNKRTKFIAQVGFYGLALGLMAYAAMRTLDFVQGTMPQEKQFWGYLFLLSTGVGAIIWLMVYLWLAEGAKQRGLAFMMGIVDLIGEMVMVYADTVRVSAANGQLTMSQTDLQTFIMASVGVIAVNIVAAYAFHLFDPKAERDSQARDLVDEVTDSAMKSLQTPAAKQSMIDELAPTLKSAILEEVASQVRAQAGEHVRQALTRRTAALPAPLNVPPAPLSQDLGQALDASRLFRKDVKAGDNIHPIAQPNIDDFAAQGGDAAPTYHPIGMNAHFPAGAHEVREDGGSAAPTADPFPSDGVQGSGAPLH